jgi:hypothetical protein
MFRLIYLCGLVGIFFATAGCGVTSTGSGGQTSAPPTQGVTVHLDRTSFIGKDSIKVSVQNALTVPIYAHDTAASCSILLLQEQVNGVWQGSAAAPCPLKRPAMIVKIDAGGTYAATITASYPGFPTTAFPAGTYQLMLPYATTPDALQTSDSGHTITSVSFTVNG